jgi:hypothetical protein
MYKMKVRAVLLVSCLQAPEPWAVTLRDGWEAGSRHPSRPVRDPAKYLWVWVLAQVREEKARPRGLLGI